MEEASAYRSFLYIVRVTLYCCLFECVTKDTTGKGLINGANRNNSNSALVKLCILGVDVVSVMKPTFRRAKYG